MELLLRLLNSVGIILCLIISECGRKAADQSIARITYAFWTHFNPEEGERSPRSSHHFILITRIYKHYVIDLTQTRTSYQS
ncbi:hypothetical protein BDP55DRAFT_639785 [Colletotrichum godetiae]|uniref:Secreted protein n=1 Tax=Colletotrichum godetiae TaxID=1209918 RepID=A0AAJ0F2N9_9PEZI|nr:uncharacterized protein BDP55DRAFT_639785 [Colletotrichum godetiae]KAK1700861.1 hypothetical protein BDP55DRAFT_639785 [Colletotrichum godetiae]